MDHLTDNSPSKGAMQTLSAGLLLAILATIVLKSLDFLFIPLVVALLFCYALGIPFEQLRSSRVPRWLIILGMLVAVMVLAYLMGRLLHANIRQFQEHLPVYEEKFWAYAQVGLDRLEMSPEQAKETFNAFLANLGKSDLKPLGTALQQLSGSFFSFLGNVIWVLLFMMFILAERENFARRLAHGMGEERAVPILAAMDRINRAVQHYLGLKTLVSLATGLLVALALWGFGVHFALLWGVVAFLLNFIPNIGSLIATVPPVAVTLFQFGSFGRAILVAILLTMVQLLVGNLLEPKLMGKGLNLSPLVVLLSLLFWGWLWGLPGMLLAVPLTAAVKIGLEQVDSTRPLALLMGSE